MTISSSAELAALEAVGRVVGRTLGALIPRVRAGVSTAELDDAAADLLDRQGARSAPALVYGFPGAICISVNEEVVHGLPGKRTLRAGDVVTVDVTAEKNGFMADAARTVVVGPKTPKTKQQWRLAAAARVAFAAAMTVARAGGKISDLGRAMEQAATGLGFSTIRDLTGHGIGRTIHEEPAIPCFGDPGSDRRLEEGMVLAVEPLVSAGSVWTRVQPDGWVHVTEDGSLASHHENTIVVTRSEPLVLTAT